MYNEQESVGPLYQAIVAAVTPLGYSFEMVFVDDGSADRTVAVATELARNDPRLRIVKFRRNYGQTAAMAAGIEYARGDILVTMDGDLQNDPEDIGEFVAKIEEGYDIVAGWRKDRKDAFINRRLPSIIANSIISWATGVHLHDYGCSLKVFRAEVVKPLRLYGEMHRFLPAIASQIGVRIAEMVVNHRARSAGTTKYGLSRTVRVILDLATVKFLLSYSTRPLQIFGLLGLITGGVGALITAYLAYIRLFTTQGIGDRPLLLLGVMLVFIGVQLVTFGLLAEVMARTYYESQDKPTYVIREVRESVSALAAPAERAHQNFAR